MRIILVCVTLAAAIISTAATARERTLNGISGGRLVFVWNDKDAHSEAMSLIEAGVYQSNPTLVERLLACIVPAGTKAVITGQGFVTHDILVTSGDSSGCRGNVAAEVFHED